jgi:hypothetical protein
MKAISLDDLCGYLLTHELCLEQQVASFEITLSIANMATRASPNQQDRGNQNYNFSKGSSNYAGRSHGRGRGRGGQPNAPNFFQYPNSSQRPFCQICFKVGHYAPSCWHHFEQNFQPQGSQNAQANFTTSPTPADQTWYPDTRANNHITSELGNLNLNAEDYTGPEQVQVGNGQGLKILHISSFVLCSSSKSFFLSNVLHVPHIQKIYFHLSFCQR